MNTLELDKKVTARGFLGTYAYDKLPEKPKNDQFSLIVNTSASNTDGDHWVALIRSKNVFYFLDSYGRALNDATLPKQFSVSIKKYVGRNHTIKHNSKWLQQLTSNTCGEYCVYFIQEFEKVGFRRLLRVFTQKLKNNDNYVLKYVQKMI